MAAVELLAAQGCWRRLLQVAAGLGLDTEQDREAVRCAAAAFKSTGQSETARELLSRLGDHKACADRMLSACHPSACAA
jgi:hypothetical protein